MRTLEATAFSLDALKLVERPVPQPRRGEILVRVKAASLNYRDLAVLSGSYLPDLALPYVPASDACGRVEAVGEDVTRFAVGDRVIPCYIQGWRDGALTAEQRFNNTLGGPLPGVLQDYVAVPAEDAVAAPPQMSDAEASTLPIAALTAWSCLMAGGLKSGDSVLVQGTGGVALFALQLAKSAGARVVALTSSEKKAELLRRLGAEAVINRVPAGKRYYLTIDIDGFDPSIAPGTGTPSHGGFLYYEVLEILQGLATRGDIVGIDLVEVAPDYDHAGTTAFLAAQLLMNVLGFVFHAQGLSD